MLALLLILVINAVKGQLNIDAKPQKCDGTKITWPDKLNNLDGQLQLICHPILHSCEKFKPQLSVCSKRWTFECAPRHYVNAIRKTIRKSRNDTHYQVQCCTNPILHTESFGGEASQDLYAGHTFDAAGVNLVTGRQALYLANIMATSPRDHHTIKIGRIQCIDKTEPSTKKPDEKAEREINKFKQNLGVDSSASLGALCFPDDARVVTLNGTKTMSELKKGDMVKVLTTQSKEPSFQPIQFFVHREPDRVADFITFKTNIGRSLTLTSLHLIPVLDCKRKTLDLSELSQFMEYAMDLKPGDCILINDEGHLVMDQITQIGTVQKRGVYAPHVESGLLLVDTVVVSCYAHIKSHQLQNLFFTNMFKLTEISSWVKWIFSNNGTARMPWLEFGMAINDLLFSGLV